MLLLLCGRAYGHAVLLDSAPKAGAQVEQPPSEVVLTFNENVGPVFFRLLNASGDTIESVGEIGIDGNSLLLPLTEPLSDGTYIASYRVISADTHPVGGSVVFAVGEAIADVGAMSADPGTSAWRVPVVINRIVLYLAGLLAIGSVLYRLWMQPQGPAAELLRRQGLGAAAFAGLALLLSVPLGGAEMIAGGASAPFSGDAWRTAFGSTLGPSLLLGLPGALLVAYGFASATSGRPLVSAIGGALLLGSYLVTGHAATAAPVWLMATMVGVHLICGGFWFAALRPLGRTTADGEVTVAAAAAVRFSQIAVWTVSALLLSGIIVTWVQVQSVSALFDNAYGIRLSIKIALFVVLVAIAAYNKLRLTPRLASGESGAADGLRRTIRIEYALMVAIAVLAASLTLPTPPRALAATSGAGPNDPVGGQTLTLTQDGYRADLEITSTQPGENMVMVTFTDDAGNAVDLVELTVEFGLPAASITGIEQRGEPVAPGRYHLMFDQLVIPGEWTVQVDAFVTDFDKVILRGTVPIR